ncbi:Tetratricopeptide-like helical [Penicillium occitanis (nom. inval.)]|nr:Tetratricopeptide-like helical [Penicillium occitanis (nom. inval.)]PCH03265.1 hypothetical protein PENOC_039590 [Penicillium occitanis (nom. inval.)]
MLNHKHKTSLDTLGTFCVTPNISVELFVDTDNSTWSPICLTLQMRRGKYDSIRATSKLTLNSPLRPEELQVLRAQYEKEGEFVGVQTKFNYAWGLIKSDKRNEQQEGVQLLSQIFRTALDRRRECLYYIALGNFKLGNYAEARRYNDLLLEHEPDNLQAASLQQLIDDKVAKEGLVGVAIVGGVALAAGLIGGLLVRGSRRR